MPECGLIHLGSLPFCGCLMCSVCFPQAARDQLTQALPPMPSIGDLPNQIDALLSPPVAALQGIITNASQIGVQIMEAGSQGLVPVVNSGLQMLTGVLDMGQAAVRMHTVHFHSILGHQGCLHGSDGCIGFRS